MVICEWCQHGTHSDIVIEGKLIGENTYTDRAAKYPELQLNVVKIDYYDAKNKVVHEIKKKNKENYLDLEQALKYYLLIN